EVGAENVVNIHVTLVPYIKAAHELKTKPTQQSVAKLREIGLQPQVLICRTEKPLDRDVRQKLSMFCSVSEKAVIEARDVEHTVPYLDRCLGMQIATIEFARNACGIKNANSTEFDKNAAEPVISLLEEQRGVRKKGGSMRLGTWPTKIVHGTLAAKIYRRDD